MAIIAIAPIAPKNESVTVILLERFYVIRKFRYKLALVEVLKY